MNKPIKFLFLQLVSLLLADSLLFAQCNQTILSDPASWTSAVMYSADPLVCVECNDCANSHTVQLPQSQGLLIVTSQQTTTGNVRIRLIRDCVEPAYFDTCVVQANNPPGLTNILHQVFDFTVGNWQLQICSDPLEIPFVSWKQGTSHGTPANITKAIPCGVLYYDTTDYWNSEPIVNHRDIPVLVVNTDQTTYLHLAPLDVLLIDLRRRRFIIRKF